MLTLMLSLSIGRTTCSLMFCSICSNNRQNILQIKAPLREILDNVFPLCRICQFFVIYGQYQVLSTYKKISLSKFHVQRKLQPINKNIQTLLRNKECKLRHTQLGVTGVTLYYMCNPHYTYNPQQLRQTQNQYYMCNPHYRCNSKMLLVSTRVILNTK